ncbi:MAG: tRNA preQ1(34) S-adenosylmethionine ribosyltransferase-isomerase QueA [Spirochaetales bacterium]
MKTSDFSFHLPDELVAQAPPSERGQSRLLVLDPVRQTRSHRSVAELAQCIAPGTLMVFNDTRVRKARVFGTTEHGGRVEVVLLRPLTGGPWEALVNKAKKLRFGQKLRFPGDVMATVASAEGNVRVLHFEPPITELWLEAYGHLPLPPYIQRPDTEADAERYQTIYARETGSAAAPTAGLHFTQSILDALTERGVELAYVTLEVGLGTFLPVRAENVADHKMHTERYHLSESAVAALNRARGERRPILAVGTTSLRTLEASFTADGWAAGHWEAGSGSTDIFITPGYRFRAVDQLFTNFHTPESTLLMLVCAFAGQDFMLETYRQAVEARYRFFSYGDAMLIQSRHPPARDDKTHS